METITGSNPVLTSKNKKMEIIIISLFLLITLEFSLSLTEEDIKELDKRFKK